MSDHLCSHNTVVSQIFKQLGTTRWGWIDVKKVHQRAQVLDKIQWTEDKCEAVFEGVKTNEHGFIHIKLFDEWFVSEDIDRRAFVKTFIERELNGHDKGTQVDLLTEFPTAPNVRKEVTFRRGQDIGMTCSKVLKPLYNGDTWEECTVGRVDWVRKNSQAGRAGVRPHFIILNINGEDGYCEHKLAHLAAGEEDFTVTFDCITKADPSWSPLRKTSASRAEIIGVGKDGGILIRMEDTGHELTARKGQLAVRHCQKGPQDDRFVAHHH